MNRTAPWAALAFLLLFGSRPLFAEAAPDPLLRYLIAADAANWGAGGALGTVGSYPLPLPQPLNTLRSGVLALSGHYTDYYRTAGMEHSGASFERGLRAHVLFQNARPWPWLVAADCGTSLRRISYSEPDHAQRVQIRSASDAAQFSAAAELCNVSAAAGVRFRNDNQLEPAFGLRYRYRALAQAALFWQRSAPDIQAHAWWRGEQASLALRGTCDDTRGFLSIGPWRGLGLGLRVSRQQYIRWKRPVDEVTLEPWGDASSWHGFISASRASWTLCAGSRGLRARLTAYGMQGGLPYAKITRADIDADGWFVSLQRNPWLIEAERLTLQADGRGHTEFWPFTSGLIDLLGLRRYFIATGSAKIWRVHVAAQDSLSPHWSGGAGINLFDARVDALLDHWRPEYLIFGKADEQFLRLRLYRAVAALAGFTVRWQPGAWTLAYSAQQLIPVKMWYHAAPNAPAGGTGGATSGTSRRFGGSFHALTVSRTF